MLVFYDFEVFKYDWLVVLHEIPSGERTRICNDAKKLQEFYECHKNDIWVGFNSRHYDQWILRAILGGFNPSDMNEWLIVKDKDGYLFNRALNNIKLYNYDVYKGLIDYSLKTLEGFMGHNIKESSVDFKIKRKLTGNEIAETFKYCDHDVDELKEVFIQRKDEFDTHIAMIKEFGLSMDCINKSTAQLLAIILGAQRKEFNDEFDISVPNTLILNKYAYVKDWFLNSVYEAKKELDADAEQSAILLKTGVGSKKKLKDARELLDDYEYNYDELFKKYFYNRSLKIDVAGIEHIFKWGGVHGAEKINYVCAPDELLIMADVRSLYPSIDIIYDLISRCVDEKGKKKYIHIYNTNIEMKENKDPRRPVYKLSCNISYGCKGDKFNALYDKRNQNLTCIYGQLLILDLIEKIESIIKKFIQSNTDGIAFVIKKKDFELLDDIVYEWEQRTGLFMEFTYAKKIYQGDVNNYVMVELDGSYKSKGGYVKELSTLDNDLPIVNEAIKNYLVKEIPVEETINNCNELIRFQKIVKLSSKYDYVKHNDIEYDWKSYRVFASKDKNDGMIYKCKKGNTQPIYSQKIDCVCDYDNGGGWCTNKKSEFYDKRCPFVGTNLNLCRDYKIRYYNDEIIGYKDKQDKFANTPENCFIENGNIIGMSVPTKLDRNYYIDLTKKRLKEKFNIELM